MSEQSDKLKLFLAATNKQLAKDGIPPMMTASDIVVTDKQTSGILTLDIALNGGWPTNKWVEIVGESSASKTTLALRTIAANQAINPDYSVFWIASEPFNPEWSENNGIDNDRVVVFAHNNMELCFQRVLDAASSNAFDCIVIDSYPALIASDEEKKSMDEFTIGSGAKRVGQFFRKVPDTYSEERPYLGIFINQFRDKVGAFSPYGTPKTEPGGKAKNYQFYVRVEVARDEYIEESKDLLGKVRVGQRNTYKVIKNKQGVPHRTAKADLYFDESEKGFKGGEFDVLKDLCATAVLYRVFEKSGNWLSYTDKRTGEIIKGNGLAGIAALIRGNIELEAEIRRDTLELAIQ
jgi:recombination protein RecA